MIFLGDLACPQEKITEFVSCVNKISYFDNEIVILNFEANIVDAVSDRNNISLYNVSEIVNSFSKAKKVIVSLANNHMYDYPEKIMETERILQKANIGTFGLVHGGLIEPFEFSDDDGKKYAFFGHCWRLYTKTNPNIVNDTKVVDVPYDEFISCIENYTNAHENTMVYCFMHWNYDLEIVPFPMQRELARKLIDAGARGVIGSHPHVVQGYETYKNCPIAYSLGNFYIPSGIFFGGTLSYPDESKYTLAINTSESGVERTWFRTDSDIAPISILRNEEAVKLDEKATSIAKYDLSEYKRYFKKVRRKKFLVPVYNYPFGIRFRIQEAWAIIRVKLIKKLKG